MADCQPLVAFETQLVVPLIKLIRRQSALASRDIDNSHDVGFTIADGQMLSVRGAHDDAANPRITLRQGFPDGQEFSARFTCTESRDHVFQRRGIDSRPTGEMCVDEQCG